MLLFDSSSAHYNQLMIWYCCWVDDEIWNKSLMWPSSMSTPHYCRIIQAAYYEKMEKSVSASYIHHNFYSHWKNRHHDYDSILSYYKSGWDSPLKNFLLRYWAPAECYFIPTGYCGILHVQTFCYLFSFLYSFVSWSFLKLPEDNFYLGYQLSGYLSTIVFTT
jgi:hypothetical protein